ncbi:MAG: hypothetical protein ACKVX7_10150 [Planctomycetota bacterium]
MKRVVCGVPLLALVLGLSFGISRANAADKDFDQNTILLWSSDDMAALRAGTNASQLGAFLNDPAISSTIERFKGVMSEVFAKAMAEDSMPAEKKDQLKPIGDLLKEYGQAIFSETTGRFAFAAGYRQDTAGAMQPDVILHFQGSEKFDAMHGRMIELLAGLAGSELTRATVDLGGVSFKGLMFPEAPTPPPFKAPDGFLIGRKENHYYLGISKDGLRTYLESSNGQAQDGRLGGVPFYGRSLAAIGAGQQFLLLNLAPLWKLLPMAFGMAGPGGAQASTMFNSLGLTGMDGLAVNSTSDAQGMKSATIFGMNSRKGLLELLPTADGAMSIPQMVPASALQLQMFRLNLDKVLELVLRIVGETEGEAAVNMMTQGMASFETEIGVKPADIFRSLEGSLFYVELPDGGNAGMGMNPMMGMMGVSQHIGFGLRLRDSSVIANMLAHVAQRPDLASVFKAEDFQGKRLYSFSPDGGGDTDAGMASGVQPGLVIDGDWLVIALIADDAKEMLRVSAGDDTGRLAGSARVQTLMSQVGSAAGMGLAYQHTGKIMGKAMDTLRMAFGFAGMVPGVGESEALLELLNPSNVPPGEVFEKYFGETVSTGRLSGQDLIARSWAPNPVKPATASATPPK